MHMHVPLACLLFPVHGHDRPRFKIAFRMPSAQAFEFCTSVAKPTPLPCFIYTSLLSQKENQDLKYSGNVKGISPPLFVANGRATPPTAVKMAPEIMSFL